MSWKGFRKHCNCQCPAGYVVPFRDALLRGQPLFFPWLLGHASQSEIDSSIHQLCVAVLSSPFPEDVALPASAHEFVEKLRDRNYDIEIPNVSWIRAVFLTFEAGGPHLLFATSIHKLVKLQEFIRRRLLPSDEYQFQLLGLALLSQLALLPFNGEDNDGQDASEDSIPAAAFAISRRYLFSGNVTRTLDVLLVGSTWCCTNAANLSREELKLYFKLALEVSTKVEPGQKAQWTSSNCLKVQKLYDKISTANLEWSVRGAAVGMIVSLLGSRRTLPGLTTLAEGVVTSSPWAAPSHKLSRSFCLS